MIFIFNLPPARWPVTLGWRRRRRSFIKMPGFKIFFSFSTFLFSPKPKSELRFHKIESIWPRSKFEYWNFFDKKRKKTQTEPTTFYVSVQLPFAFVLDPKLLFLLLWVVFVCDVTGLVPFVTVHVVLEFGFIDDVWLGRVLVVVLCLDVYRKWCMDLCWNLYVLQLVPDLLLYVCFF